MELDPPAGLEAQVFSALDQPVSVSPMKTSWWIGGMAVAAAVIVAVTAIVAVTLGLAVHMPLWLWLQLWLWLLLRLQLSRGCAIQNQINMDHEICHAINAS